MLQVIKTALVLYLAELLVVVYSLDSSKFQLESQRHKRESPDFAAELTKGELMNSKSSQSLTSGVNFEDVEESAKEKRYSTFEDLNKRLRQFIGKRTSDMDLEKRMRYFLGKRFAEPEVEKRMRYFLGKRDDYYGDLDKRMRYFLGKRFSPDFDEQDTMKRSRYFLGKRSNGDLLNNEDAFLFEPVSSDDYDVNKRSRYFLGKRMRYLIGKRDGEAAEKRMRYFLGKRSVSSQDTPHQSLNSGMHT